MTYHGRIKGGMVVLDDPNGLAEGTEVEVAPVVNAPAPSWADVLKDVIGAAKGLPVDS